MIATADFVARHAHAGLRHAFTLIDMAAAFAAVFTLFALLRRSAVYRGASPQGRWFAALAFVVLVQFYMAVCAGSRSVDGSVRCPAVGAGGASAEGLRWF